MEAMPKGGQLVVRTRTTRKGVALDLIDTGCGMEASALIHMFQEFYTSKDGGHRTRATHREKNHRSPRCKNQRSIGSRPGHTIHN